VTFRKTIRTEAQNLLIDLFREYRRVATGFQALDERLPGGGWPIGALIEILPACKGNGLSVLTFFGLWARPPLAAQSSACGPAKWLTDRPLAAPKRSLATDACSAEVGHNQPVPSIRQISEKLPSTDSSIIQKYFRPLPP
jgi:hypothetical protein